MLSAPQNNISNPKSAGHLGATRLPLLYNLAERGEVRSSPNTQLEASRILIYMDTNIAAKSLDKWESGTK